MRLLLISVALACLAVTGQAAPRVRGDTARIIVGYARSEGSAARALEEQLGARPVAAIPQLGVHVVEVAPGRTEPVLAALRSSPIVRYAQRDHVVRALGVPNDELWPTQWSPRKTNAPKAWDLTTGSPQVVVAIVDSGADPSQPDLRTKLVPGYDFVNGDAVASDDNGHGTAVAGVAAASSNNGIGVAGYCWRCRIMPVKVLGADGEGFSSTFAQGIVWATDHGARVINASLGGPDADAAVGAAAQYAWAHGVLLVAAAGNDGSSVLEYPAALPHVLSVGASDQRDRLYDYSNSGASLAAPGENSTTSQGVDYVRFAGTSSATPVVSGIAGLLLSAAPAAGPAELTQTLEQTAARIPGVTFGRVDAYEAVHALAPGLAPPSQAEDPAVVVAQTQTGRLGLRGRTVAFSSGAGLLRVTLVLRPRARQDVVLQLRRGAHLLASAHGRLHIRLRARVLRARYLLVISGADPEVSFSLAVRHPRAR